MRFLTDELIERILAEAREILCTLGVELHRQLARPGAPILYSGSPAAFDARHSTTPMGTIDRKASAVWRADGATTLNKRAHREIERHLTRQIPPELPDATRRELTRLM